MKFLYASALALAFATGHQAFAQPTADVTLDHGAVWQTLKTGETTDGFVEIHNNGAAPDVLTGWDCTIANATALVDAQGKPLPSLPIPAGGTVTLAQNGPHLLLQNTHYTVNYGSVVPCAFTFENAGDIGGFLNAIPAPKAPGS